MFHYINVKKYWECFNEITGSLGWVFFFQFVHVDMGVYKITKRQGP